MNSHGVMSINYFKFFFLIISNFKFNYFKWYQIAQRTTYKQQQKNAIIMILLLFPSCSRTKDWYDLSDILSCVDITLCVDVTVQT